jgi:hypothetical protein
MTPTHSILLSAAASAVLIATAALAQPEPAAVGSAKLTTVLLGANEVPGPGDPDGKGEATIIFNPGKGLICWEIHVRDIQTAHAAHIHVGARGVAGPVVLGLSPPITNNNSEGCEAVDPRLADAIRKVPANYYVNVHNATYPDGALRGQLG